MYYIIIKSSIPRNENHIKLTVMNINKKFLSQLMGINETESDYELKS